MTFIVRNKRGETVGEFADDAHKAAKNLARANAGTIEWVPGGVCGYDEPEPEPDQGDALSDEETAEQIADFDQDEWE